MAAFGVNATEQVRELLTTVVDDTVTTLGSSVQPGQLSRTIQQIHPEGEEQGKGLITISLLDGIEYVTEIDVKQGGLDMTRLAMLFRSLPKLRVLRCNACDRAPQRSNRLPPVLPSLVPDLTAIYMSSSGLVGPIPSTYGAFPMLTEIFLMNNQLTGQLPPELANMKSMASISLQKNRLTGEVSIHIRGVHMCPVTSTSTTHAYLTAYLKVFTICMHALVLQ
jgi:hypothetical protein